MQPPLVDWRDIANAECPCQLSSLHSDGCGRSLELDRDRLQFNLSFGSGWFGWIVQGVYKREGVDGAAEEVIVQVLKEEASMDEEIGFREISLLAVMGGGHPNVLHLVGHSYDAIPRLQAYELCALGDLKSFLADNRGQRRLSPANQIPRQVSPIHRSHRNVQQARHRPQLLSGNRLRPRPSAPERLRRAGLGRALRPGHGRHVGEGELIGQRQICIFISHISRLACRKGVTLFPVSLYHTHMLSVTISSAKKTCSRQ